MLSLNYVKVILKLLTYEQFSTYKITQNVKVVRSQKVFSTYYLNFLIVDVRFAIKEKLRRLPDLSKIGCDLSFQTSRLPH